MATETLQPNEHVQCRMCLDWILREDEAVHMAGHGRPMHSDDVGLRPITLDKDDRAFCPNEFPHVPHTNAVWLDWQRAESYECSGNA